MRAFSPRIAAACAMTGGMAVNAHGADQFSIGANVQAVSSTSRDFAFVDLMKQTPAFGSPVDPFDPAGAPALDADGWPTDDFGLVLFSGMDGVAGLGGSYRIEFDAFALPFVSGVDSPGRVRSVIRDPVGGRVTVIYDFPNGGDQLALSIAFTGGGGRNITVQRPGANADPTFYDPYLEHVSRFDALRFGAWTATNNHPASAWEDRATAGTPSYAGPLGVPWERCVELSNAADADMWINVPHMATDGYVRELARLVRDGLDADLAVYVEYSSEVWNPAHTQQEWNLDQAVAEVAGATVPLDYDGSSDPDVWAARRVGEQAVRVATIFEEEFGPGSVPERVRPIIATQTDQPWQLAEAMRYIEAVHGDPAAYVFGVAGAPLFDLQGLDGDPTLTQGEVLAGLGLGIDRWRGSQEMEIIASQAAYFGVEMLAYGAGPDTAGPNNIDAKRDAALSVQMGTLCAASLDAWARDGGGMATWSVAGAGSYATDAGTFPITEDLAITDTPKLLTLDAVQGAESPVPTAGLAVPALLDARRHTLRPADWQTASPSLDDLEAGDVYEYLVRSDAGGVFRVFATTASPGGGGGAELSVNASAPVSVTASATGSFDAFATADGSIAVMLDPGLSTVRVRVVDGGSFAIGSVRVACPADIDGDGALNINDVEAFVDAYLSGTPCGDQDLDGDTDADDMPLFVARFVGGC